MPPKNLKQNSKFYIPIKFSNINMNPSDPQGLLDESFHALSPRYLLRNMPGFIFILSTIYGGLK